MQEPFSDLWREVGIFYFIKMTCTHYYANTPLVSAMTSFQKPNCNAFLFLCRPMMIILLDVVALTSLPIIGVEVGANLSIDGLPNYEFLAMNASQTFNQFQ